MQSWLIKLFLLLMIVSGIKVFASVSQIDCDFFDSGVNQDSTISKPGDNLCKPKVVLKEISESLYSEYKKKTAMIINHRKMQKSSGILSLELDNNRKLELRDTRKSIEYESDTLYKLMGSISEPDLLFIEVYLWERGECWVVDKKSGERTVLWWAPVISRDKKYFLTYSGTYDFDAQEKGIKIFRYEDSKLVLVWELELSDWFPEEAYGLNDKEFIMKKYIPSEFSKSKKDEFQFILISILD